MARTLADEEQSYWDRWIETRDPHAGEQLIKMYMPLVNFHVQRMSVGLPRNINFEELRSHGMLGLYDALNKFDSKRDLKFDTYASFRVRGAILDGLRREDWLPRSLREKAKKLEATIEKLEQKFLRPVTLKEIADDMGLSEEEVATIQSESFFANMLSMDDDQRELANDEKPSYTIVDKKTLIPEKELIKSEVQADLANIIKSLNQKEQLVITLFYYEECTLTEIGKLLNLSTSRISQIHSKALFRLKQAMENNR